MQPGWGCDIDDIDVGHRQHLVERGGAAGYGEFVADCCEPLLVEVAQRAHLELRGQAGIALFDMAAADAASDHRDGPAFGHGMFSLI